MRPSLLCVCLGVVLFATSNAQADEGHWQSLFDGKSLRWLESSGP